MKYKTDLQKTLDKIKKIMNVEDVRYLEITAQNKFNVCHKGRVFVGELK